MKKITLFLIIFSFLGSACKKDAAKSLSESGPTIKAVSAFKAYAGSQQDVGFNVDIIADSSMVDYVELYRVPADYRWRVDHPYTGHFIMYDRIGDYQPGAKYYFVFGMHDGTLINSDPYTLP